MNELPERIKQRLYKLLELATRGAGGERENAESRLDALLEKHGVKKEDFIETESTQEFFFTFKNKFEKRLFLQISSSLGIEHALSYRGTKQLSVECTVAQNAELQIKYSVYRKALQDEFEMTFEAFIHSQEIYSPSAMGDDSTDNAALSTEEQERVNQVASRSMMMDRINVHPALESK